MLGRSQLVNLVNIFNEQDFSLLNGAKYDPDLITSEMDAVCLP